MAGSLFEDSFAYVVTSSASARDLEALRPENTPFFIYNPDSRSVLEMNSAKTAHTSSCRSPLRSIREKCIDCCAGNKAEVARCEIQSSALWPFRMGRNPNRAGMGGKPGVGFTV
jgi:hypothetical protein